MFIKFKTLKYEGESIKILNQLLLPSIIEYETYSDYIDIIDAINSMKIRGAAYMGIAASYGFLISLKNKTFSSKLQFKKYYETVKRLFLKTSSVRFLNYAFGCFDKIVERTDLSVEETIAAIKDEAVFLELKEKISSEKVVKSAVERVFNEKETYKFLTLGNYGALSVPGMGYTTGLFNLLAKNKIDIEVYIDETRPHFEGSRLTAWELKNLKIPYTIITAGETARLLNETEVDAVILGAEQIAENGDVISKIGSLNMALTASYYRVPVFVLTSTVTINPLLKTGSELPAESCKTDEILLINGVRTAPVGSKILNYSYDVVPGKFISAIITEEGIIKPSNI